MTTTKLAAILAAAGLAGSAAPVRADDQKSETTVEKKDRADGTTEKKVDKKVKHKAKGAKTAKKHVEDKTVTDANGNVVEHQHTEK